MSVPTRPCNGSSPSRCRSRASRACRWSTATRPATSPATALDQARALVTELLPDSFRNAHLFDADGEVQLTFSKKGKPMLQRHGAQAPREAATSSGHDREKKRYLELSRPFLRDLGVTDAQGALIPSMSRKWKQINKFIEVFDHATASAPVPVEQALRVADFGSGKGYLTFAMHDYLRNSLAAKRR